jgi:ATP phosphoribosyltransferase regulatory subunit HisZ
LRVAEHKLPNKLQALNLAETVAGIFRYLITPISPSAGVVKQMDAIQRRMFSIIARSRARAVQHGTAAVRSQQEIPEARASFHRLVTCLIEQSGGKWSARLHVQHKLWIIHLARHSASLAAQVLEASFMHDTWLQEQRTPQHLFRSSSALGARRRPGRPIRWLQDGDRISFDEKVSRLSVFD